jgi:alpha-tubulin suppressor-like RCC1 family protein
LTNVVQIATGDYHGLALKRDGTVVAWGFNDVGQCNVPPGLTNVVAIAARAKHSMVLINERVALHHGH